ncbi:hypothetical protein CAI21_11455 [Alkalilimnicola ehrlichii]|uniref:BON domain-containing protein n=1 Tax=Alkalilimnicola ehrlichii TaxID=351052 RepID=A0A3E0WIP1_9GAMM|nr:BON domain-containing protein [Alkalilimnicola ehrlichii]RFA29050.1 hypothetical protein CAI21_11455 [Alkalilimnicola ehrlichii]RFA31836.1 hypothetical protein CAL65_21280 [Alkalilimnicola ehrlichii]
MHDLIPGLFLLLTLALVPQPSYAFPEQDPELITAAAQARLQDLAITDAIYQKLATVDNLRNTNLNIQTQEGEVHISGYVPDFQAAIQLIELAETVEGVKHVSVTLREY